MTATKRTPPQGNRTHGITATYMAGCSCRACRAAAARYRSELRDRHRAEQEAAMDAERRTIDEWSLEAACRGLPTTIWFPAVTTLARTDRPATPVPAAAAVVCERCPVSPECLDYALRHNVDGIWGATNEQGRRNLRRAAGITAIPLVPSELRTTYDHDPEERTAS